MKTRLILFIILVLSVFAHNDETGGTKKAYYITISTITVNSTTSISFTGTVDLTDIDYAQWKVDGGSYQNFDPNNLGTGITVTVSAMATGVYHTLYLKAVYDTGGGGGSTPGPDVEVNYVYDVFERYANQSFYVNGPPVSISVTGKNSMGSTSSNFALNENFYYDVASTYGVVAYKWSEDNSVWSSEIAYTTNLYASSLSDSMKTYGNHTLYFKGKSQDGSWMSSSVSKNYSISEFPPADISVSHNLSDLNEVFEKDSLEFTIASTYSVTQYKWQLNDSVWSDPVSQSTVLDFETIFADAANRIGSHTVSFIGGNSNNEWMATIDKVSFNLTITFYNSSRNYMILTNSGVSANDSLTSLDSKSRSVVSKSISYTDAIGRKLQSVARQGSGSGKDIIMHVEYDQYGLQSKEFLPYVSTDSTGSYKISSATEQSAYYSGSGYDNTKKIQLTNYPYSETKTEHSPLNKAVEKGAPGATWRLGAGHTALTKTAVNDSAEVFYFDEDGLKSTTNNYYPAESLRIIETIDENGNSSFEYSDSRDKVVMKKSNDGTNDIITYYVYDDDGNLRFIIPPMASATITSGANWDADSETHLNSWVTRFIYDSQNRLIEKRTPEAGTIYTAYDNLDRPVMTQDENLKAKGYWMFSKFDYKNRPVYTGIVQLASSRATVQTALQSESVYWESKASNEIGYTDNAYPRGVTTANILSINYYDNYDNPVTDAVDLQTAVYDAVYAFTRIEGKATASKTRVLHGSDFFSHTVYPNLIDLSSNLTGTYSYNDAQQIIFSSSTLSEIIIDSETEITVDGDAEVTIGPGLSASPVSVAMPVEFLTSYSLYDDRGRVIRSVADNPMGGKDSVITKYDWAGKITYSENYHWAAGGDDTDNKIVSTPHYDALNRLAYTSVSQIFKGRSAINYVPSLTLFNDLGQPYLSYIQPNSSYISQDGNGIYTFSGSSSDYLYSLETKMNERGWKTSIQAKKGSTVLFEEDLGYDSQLTSGTDFTAQYNGNISGVEYEQRYGTSNTRTYQYNYLYDQINQLAKAKYIAHSNAGTTDDYTVSDFAYDRNGNINRLRRKRGTDYIDDLTYPQWRQIVSGAI
ncbi:MAG: hypothetical protein KDD94_00855 [Calditrichaeota bacterium]|nr:hypothetical protein [Calditrichota bacterium]